jgi:hypothetical protein
VALHGLEELQTVLGYGMSCAAINSIDVELLGLSKTQHVGRVEGLAPMDLLAEFREPVPCGEVIPIRLHSDLLRLHEDTLGLVHWQRCIGARWLVGIFLRERLAPEFLEYTWMDIRRDLRYPTRMELQARFGSLSPMQPVTLLDYSRSGVRFESKLRPAVGEQLELHDGELLAIGTVRYARPAPFSQSYQVGCEFPNNEGIRISRRMASRSAGNLEHWTKAESWCTQRIRC